MRKSIQKYYKITIDYVEYLQYNAYRQCVPDDN